MAGATGCLSAHSGRCDGGEYLGRDGTGSRDRAGGTAVSGRVLERRQLRGEDDDHVDDDLHDGRDDDHRPAEDAVKQAYLDYWKILDRLGAAPDPDDPALAARAVDPVLSSVRADLSTRKAQGLTIQLPSGSKYAHVIRGTVVNGNSATVSDCFVDDRIQVAADGTVVNDHVSTAAAMATLIATGSDWKVSSVQIQKTGDGDLGCAG